MGSACTHSGARKSIYVKLSIDRRIPTRYTIAYTRMRARAHEGGNTMMIAELQPTNCETEFCVSEDVLALISQVIDENREALDMLAAYDRGEAVLESEKRQLQAV